MAKQYYRKKKTTTQRAHQVVPQMLLLGTGFVLGYLTGSAFSFTESMAWVRTHVLAEAKTVPATTSEAAHKQGAIPKPKFEFYTLLANDHAEEIPDTHHTAQAPVALTVTPSHVAPQSTLNVAQSVDLSDTTATPPAPLDLTVTQKLPLLHTPAVIATRMDTRVDTRQMPSTMSTGLYTVQVASFRWLPEAERMKNQLVRKGFDVTIMRSPQGQLNWYRVMIGPFSSRVDAEHAQLIFSAREHVRGMIRKMDA
jgi:cell division protein FtsN